eukprot:CAMPEP_0198609932 /NCGR_PEP_ID=MMETSP1462-20131121/156645_1 /TAXON_ID=1333877 /ORGANISM="Brandtodinium nutriculum, Strain RCC3387" /LENGTH=277 /DNA_ID=CAMNT_0044341739 /DNA_START=31 /DNA_END=864 /DNA_ORIENTATION=-
MWSLRLVVSLAPLVAAGSLGTEMTGSLNASRMDYADCVDLDSGHAINSSDPNAWPCVRVSYGAGTWTNIPKFPNLLGKTLKVTLDLSAVGCRFVLAFQMVDSDHAGGQYCDGQSGDPCVEVDFMEANQYVWGTTIHAGAVQGGWKGGIAGGYGGDRRGMDGYGVHAANVDTAVPIDVNWGFPTDGDGNLKYIFVGVYQHGSYTPKATFTVGAGQDLRDVTDALRRGMTPGFSYWSTGAGGVPWFDQPNCNYRDQDQPAYFSNWQLLSGALDMEIVLM